MPRLRQPPLPSSLPPPCCSGAAPVQPRRILVAEDVEINRAMLKRMLANWGHVLVFAEDGLEALALVGRLVFDLVLMDVQMPFMDGLEATVRIRALTGPERNVPIVGLAAGVTAGERRRCLDAGMNACITKPVEAGQLQAVIARYGPAADGFLTTTTA